MSSYFTTAAIPLGYQRRNDDDRIYTLLLSAGGRLEAVAEGSAKILSKLAGHLEPFGEAVVTVVRRGHTAKLTGAVCRRRFLHIARSLESMAAAGACLRISRLLVGVGQVDTLPYALLRQTMAVVDDGLPPVQCDAAPAVYAIQLIAALGWRPQLDRCGRCGAAMTAGAFDVPSGSVRCAACATALPDGLPLEAESLAYVRTVLRLPVADALAVVPPAAAVAVCRQLGHAVAAYHAAVDVG